MASFPRIITVDPTWTIARIVRAAVDLTDRIVTQIDVPGGAEALEELGLSKADLVITAVELNDEMKGFEMALRARQIVPELGIIILADSDDPEVDEETRAESPFIYMQRPVDVQQFMRVFAAGLEGQDMREAYDAPQEFAAASLDFGAVPALDVKVAETIIDHLLTDVGAMAIILVDRTGEVLLEGGAVGYLNREQLVSALLPMVQTTVSMGELVGGQTSALQFYDGDNYDVFVLSIGFHHSLCLVFDGQGGSRQFGAVNRFGRRAAEDLIALLGTQAFTIEKPAPTEAVRRKPKRKTTETEVVAEDLEPVAVRAETWEEPEVEEPEPFQLEPIENLDLSIFDNLGKIDANAAEDLFDVDNIEDSSKDVRRGRSSITYEEAKQLGILK